MPTKSNESDKSAESPKDLGTTLKTILENSEDWEQTAINVDGVDIPNLFIIKRPETKNQKESLSFQIKFGKNQIFIDSVETWNNLKEIVNVGGKKIEKILPMIGGKRETKSKKITI